MSGWDICSISAVLKTTGFPSISATERNAALNTVDTKRQLIELKNQDIDVSHFEENMNTFLGAISRNYKLASNKFDDAVNKIDKTIKYLQDIRDDLTGSKNQLRIANEKAEDISIKKLTAGSPSIAKKFEELGVEINNKKKKKTSKNT